MVEPRAYIITNRAACRDLPRTLLTSVILGELYVVTFSVRCCARIDKNASGQRSRMIRKKKKSSTDADKLSLRLKMI